MAYYVVYEYDETHGGRFGSRFLVPYASEEAYLSVKIDGLNMIEAGVTEEEAQNLVHLTPEICRLFTAIEGLNFESDSRITDADPVRMAVIEAHRQIAIDRNVIKAHSLTRPDASKYITALKKIAYPGPLTLKSATQTALLSQIRNDFGQVSDKRK